MKTILFKMLLAMLVCCFESGPAAADGPGMVVHFASLKNGVTTNIKSARLPSGADFPHAGSIGPNKEWHSDGATMGAAPDGRELPEWVEFEWQEWPSSYKGGPSDPEAYNAWAAEVRALSKTLPRQTQRVMVRDRVPAEAVDELMQSKRAARRGQFPDKWLWVNFIWTDHGIKFRWSLQLSSPGPGVERVLSSGGDVIDHP